MRYFYVISPVGTDPDFAVKRRILLEAGASADLRPFFPLEAHTRFSVTSAAEDIRNAVFVLADLTLGRPSCYFELGIAEALGHPVEVIAASGTQIHQMGTAGPVRFFADLAEYQRAVESIVDRYGP